MLHFQWFLWLPVMEFWKVNELVRIFQCENRGSGELETERELKVLKVEFAFPAPGFPAEFIINP